MFGVVRLRELCQEIAEWDARSASDDDLRVAVLELSKAQSLLAAGRAHALAELDVRKVIDREDGLTTSSWVAREAGLPKGAARRELKVAVKLRALAEVDEALSAGRINAAHAGVLVDACNPRVTDTVVRLQSTFLGLIEGASFDQWRNEVRDLVAVLDADGAYDPDQDLARNRVHIARTIDGIVHLKGEFVGAAAETVMQGLEALTDEQFKLHARDQHECPALVMPERSNLRAIALVELSGAVPPSTFTPPSNPGPTSP